ncbi:MAG TPA: MarR family transcriptional regulator [Thermoplasmata archaeon]|nr:MarR family transcriptional regulator [Thermoplasmata archaeon]
MAPVRHRRPGGARRAAERLSETVARLSRGWMRLGREEARAIGLSLPQAILLRNLRETGPTPVTHWVGVTGVSPSTATSLLDGLEAEGYVVRTHDRSDRRQVLISLTSAGRRVSHRLTEEFRRRWVDFCEEIPSAHLDSAAATLERIAGRMAAVVPDPACATVRSPSGRVRARTAPARVGRRTPRAEGRA